MATVWTLTLGTSFDLKSGGASVANFTVNKATLPGEISSGAINTNGASITSGEITASGNISATGKTVSCATVSTTDLNSTNLNATKLDVASSKFVVDSSGNLTASTSIASSGTVKGKGLEGTSLNVKTGKITCGEVAASGSVSSSSGFYVQ